MCTLATRETLVGIFEFELAVQRQHLLEATIPDHGRLPRTQWGVKHHVQFMGEDKREITKFILT
jgi:hypothetical protein